MTKYTDFKAFLDPSLIAPHRRKLWELMDLLLDEHQDDLDEIQIHGRVVLSTATVVASAADCDAAYLAVAGEAAQLGDALVATVSTTVSLLVKVAAGSWRHFASAGALS